MAPSAPLVISAMRRTDPFKIHGSDVPESAQSAAIMVPIILELTGAKSVIDIGCGAGNWLATFERLGVTDYLGIDGAHLPPETLRIPHERFRPHNLATPLSLDRRFDLAVSLEVAEHLPHSASRHSWNHWPL